MAFAAMLMAGLDGIQNKIDPASRWTRTSTTCRRRSCKRCPRCPGSLEEALNALENDHEFLLKGDVFTQDVIDTWIDYKRKKRGGRDPAAPAPVRVRPLLRHLGVSVSCLPALRAPLGGDRPHPRRALSFRHSPVTTLCAATSRRPSVRQAARRAAAPLGPRDAGRQPPAAASGFSLSRVVASLEGDAGALLGRLIRSRLSGPETDSQAVPAIDGDDRQGVRLTNSWSVKCWPHLSRTPRRARGHAASPASPVLPPMPGQPAPGP